MKSFFWFSVPALAVISIAAFVVWLVAWRRSRRASTSGARPTLRAVLSSRAMWPAYVLAIAAGALLDPERLTRRSRECRTSGLCNGLFHETSDADCRAAPRACLVAGLCSAEGGRCVARSDEDCRFSLNCIDRGECKLVNGACDHDRDAPTDGAFCSEDTWLEQRGAAQCEWREGRCSGSAAGGTCTKWKNPEYVHRNSCAGFECAATCAETGMCRIYGHCVATADGFCAASADGCAASEACKQRGACVLDRYGRCGPDESGAACQESEACASYGWCARTEYENGEDHYMQVCFLGGRRSHLER